ncbi:hypothetical protein [Aeromonas salmonicida]
MVKKGNDVNKKDRHLLLFLCVAVAVAVAAVAGSRLRLMFLAIRVLGASVCQVLWFVTS